MGDIAQCLAAADLIKSQDPSAHISWVVRSDFESILTLSPSIDEIISFQRSFGFVGLLRLSWALSCKGFNFVYDAHNNVRSHVLVKSLRIFRVFNRQRPFRFVRRSKNRMRRFLFFNFRLRVLPTPFRGMVSFLRPLEKWFQNTEIPQKPTLESASEDFIALAPSAAWELKRWPKEYFKKLTTLLPNENFVLLGGPEDHFLEEIRSTNPERIENLSGKLDWIETAKTIAKAKLVISNDTGALHLADWIGTRAIALIGPTAFGYPSRPTTITLETSLYCKPCTKDGRGHCKNGVYKRCLFDVSPEMVAQKIHGTLK